MSIQSALPVIVGGVVVVVSSIYFCSSKGADKDAILNNMGEPGAPPSKKSKGKAAPTPAAASTPSAPKPTPAAPKATPAAAASADAKKKAKKAAADQAAAPALASKKAAAPVVEEPYDPEYPPAPAPVKAGPAPPAAAPSNKKKKNKSVPQLMREPKPAAAKPAPSTEASVEAAAEREVPMPAAVFSKPAAVAKPAPLPVTAFADGWESVTKKVKKPKAKAFEEASALEPARPAIPGATYAVPLSAAAAVGAAAAVVPEATLSEKNVLVDPRKVGVVIGPKGATLKRIEDVSGCRLDVQPADDLAKTATVKVTGPDDASLQLAEKMITELCSKGYSAKVAGESNFVESVLEVPARSVPDLIGSGGCVVKALRDACGVHVNFPTQVHKAGEAEKPLAKVVVAGPKDGVAAAKDAIKLIVQQYYAPITHPGLTHAEFNVEEWQIARFCGRAGSNVRHIQGDSKARVYVPREGSANKAVVVVGTPSQVAVAKKHVVRILESIAEEAKAKDTSEEAMAAAFRAGKAHDNDDEEPHEEWMDAYLYKR